MFVQHVFIPIVKRCTIHGNQTYLYDPLVQIPGQTNGDAWYSENVQVRRRWATAARARYHKKIVHCGEVAAAPAANYTALAQEPGACFLVTGCRTDTLALRWLVKSGSLGAMDNIFAQEARRGLNLDLKLTAAQRAPRS